MQRDLRSEIRQTRPFSSLEEEAVLNLQRTADVIGQQTAELLKAAGLTPTQYNVLRILRGAGGAGLTAGEIGERMLTRGSDVTRLLDRMEAQALVQRARSAHDRRVVTVGISPGGLQALSTLDEPMRELHLRQLGHLGGERLRQLVGLLEAARHGP